MRSFFSALVLGLSGLAITASAAESVGERPLRLLSLNLHGYHPKDEANRFWQPRGSSSTSQTEPFLTYFTRDEIARGNDKQLAQIQTEVSTLAPDLIFLQEVGAGLPESAKTCAEFTNEAATDGLGKNSALRIRDRLRARGLNYSSSLGCRGNIGWQTYADSFSHGRVGWKDSNGFHAVYDFGANPYPQGFIVEGTAILAKAPWTFIDQQSLHLPFGPSGETFFFQIATLRYGSDPRWILIANIHGGRNLAHFEQAVAIRKYLADYVFYNDDRAHFAGAIIAGDFNASLYRPGTGETDVDTIPWEIEAPGFFDYGPRASDADFANLTVKLEDATAKAAKKSETPFLSASSASVLSAAVDHVRVQRAVEDLRDFVRGPRESVLSFREGLDESERAKTCSGYAPSLEPACQRSSRIDLAFVSRELRVRSSSLLWSKDSFTSTHGPSDHPGLIVDLSLR